MEQLQTETLTQPQRTRHRALCLRYQLILVSVHKEYACDDDQDADDHVPWRGFLLANAISSIVWAASYGLGVY